MSVEGRSAQLAQSPINSSNCAQRPALLPRAALSYAAVMHHGMSFTALARQVGLSRRSISRAIQRAQIEGLTSTLPLAGLGPQTTPP
jgi:hypothetical protein